jgi:superfamily II DNA or RNA helicase
VGWIGIDVNVHVLINCVGLRDPSLTRQITGRGLRTAPDKTHLDYHDFQLKNSPMLLRHSQERMETLRSEGYSIQVKKD